MIKYKQFSNFVKSLLKLENFAMYPDYTLSRRLQLGAAYNEFPVTMSRSLCIKIIDCNVEKFSYNEHLVRTNSFFYIFYSLKAGLSVVEKSWFRFLFTMEMFSSFFSTRLC